ncbi:MAG: polyphosphate kinase 2 family protein [Verrucomicrobiota bacterium]
MIPKNIIDQFLVKAGSNVNLKDYPTECNASDYARNLSEKDLDERAKEILEKNRVELDAAQELLYANDTRSVLLIFQAMDAAGKDGTIRHVMSGVNPQGCQVFSFKQPSAEELDHNFLWRCMKSLPERGRIGIFNRSYYEDVLVVKVHPEWIDEAQFGKPDKKFWEKRYEDINNFEKHLARNGTVVIKFFLHLSKGEQKKRFLARLDDPKKQWKFSETDLPDRELWNDYQKAYGDALSATSTKKAPWYVIPADRKPFARAVVAEIIVAAINDLKLEYPKVSAEQMQNLMAARNILENKTPAEEGGGDR